MGNILAKGSGVPCNNVSIKSIYCHVIFVQVPLLRAAGGGTQVESSQVWEDKS